MPVPDDVLARVKQIATDQNQPQVARNFKYRNDTWDLPDIVEAIMDGNYEIVLQEHIIDANADDHNEVVEWRNDHDKDNRRS